MKTFTASLAAAWQDNNSLLCVGLDPDPAKFPPHLRGKTGAIFEFCSAIVDATADLACAFKPQIAYFAANRAEDQLEALIARIHDRHPGIPVILDAKRGDIGNTAEQYAVEVFERYKADAVTINPYMGRDTVEPWLAYKDKGVILLCRTSNPGGSDLQFLNVSASVGADALHGGMSASPSAGTPLFERVAHLVADEWNGNGQCALVVGATFPAELRHVREIVGEMPLLVPGIGAQGGDIEATVKSGKTTSGTGLMINSSRAILYAGKGEDFADAARMVALETRDAINRYR
ncbi:MAG: orotidine-5'-phosphate decarboxylase [Rhodocyclaceae bacterium]|nr:orotidine-5'-phosphate decarboxylase [Rhodocyclaceae bacterium]